MSRTMLFASALLVAVATPLICQAHAGSTLLGVPNVAVVLKLATLSLGLAVLALVQGGEGRAARVTRACTVTYLAGMGACFAGLALIANLPVAPGEAALRQGLQALSVLLACALAATSLRRLAAQPRWRAMPVRAHRG